MQGELNHESWQDLPLVFRVFGSHHGPINHAAQLAMVTTFEYGVAESSFVFVLLSLHAPLFRISFPLIPLLDHHR